MTATDKIQSLDKARDYLNQLRKIQQATANMALIRDRDQLYQKMIATVEDIRPNTTIIIMSNDGKYLTIGAANIKPDQEMMSTLPLDDIENDPTGSAWLAGHPFFAEVIMLPDTSLRKLIEAYQFENFISLPMMAHKHLMGVLIIKAQDSQSLSELDYDLYGTFAKNCGALLRNIGQFEEEIKRLSDNIQEISILHQIDQELSETITLERVFDMMLDWALRFTNASNATISLYDTKNDKLNFMRNYGYVISDEAIAEKRGDHQNTISHRVARKGTMEIVRDVRQDKERGWVDSHVRSQIAVPVIRDEQVVAVIMLESRHIDGFNQSHLSFMTKLAGRAGYAIDNARLFEETERERRRLTTILNSIADIVIVVDTQDKITMISQSALNALRLYPNRDYRNALFNDTITIDALNKLYYRSIEQNEQQMENLELDNERTYQVRIIPMQNIGCAIVMQDVTPDRETDQLKNDLIATVSHDLKQPLSVMRGYVDLIRMKNTFDATSINYLNRLDNGINNMQSLIDDLLDIARFESEEEIKPAPVDLHRVLQGCIEDSRTMAQQKAISLTYNFTEADSKISGDETRLSQIFNNLITNAIKYTPPEGNVHVFTEARGATLRIGVQDTGLGISPEDQAHIFERFYRIRRPETDSIEGTGLGLAIVKRLVELHNGKIRVESKLGEGTTFFVSLPY